MGLEICSHTSALQSYNGRGDVLIVLPSQGEFPLSRMFFCPSRVVLSLCLCALGTVQPVSAGTPLTTVRVASGLANPIFVTHAPGDFDRVFVIEQRGKIRIIKNGQLLATPFLDISTQVSLGVEQGLLGLAFDPDYARNRTFYINYTNLNGDTEVAKFAASEANPDLAIKPGDTILTVDQPYANHNGGWLGFGPDGYLYIALGDGGDQTDPQNRGQSISGELLGNILRIDVDGDDFPADALRDYAIPLDNPFVGRMGEDEIWAYGLRNPWRPAFDRLTGDLWIADVGEAEWEEINVQPAASNGGENYGWACTEGLHCTAFGGCNCNTLTWAAPIHEYSHGVMNVRCSITGGEVYRGCEIPGLEGTYFFGDYCSGQIWTLTYDGQTASVTDRTLELAPGSGLAISNISSFGSDAAGEIYICDRAGTTGEVYKIVPATGVPAFAGSNPPSDAIDARTPLANDGTTALGMNQVSFLFDRASHCTSPSSFSVVQIGVAGPPPAVIAVQSVQPNEMLVTLDRPIEPLAWTEITHEPTGASVKLGFLPGDVNADGHSGPADILELIDLLNGVGPTRPDWSTDIDRSGMTAPADILMLVDLLNGAGALDSYLNAHLP